LWGLGGKDGWDFGPSFTQFPSSFLRSIPSAIGTAVKIYSVPPLSTSPPPPEPKKKVLLRRFPFRSNIPNPLAGLADPLLVFVKTPLPSLVMVRLVPFSDPTECDVNFCPPSTFTFDGVSSAGPPRSIFFFPHPPKFYRTKWG